MKKKNKVAQYKGRSVTGSGSQRPEIQVTYIAGEKKETPWVLASGVSPEARKLAKKMAKEQGVTMGKVVSDLVIKKDLESNVDSVTNFISHYDPQLRESIEKWLTKPTRSIEDAEEMISKYTGLSLPHILNQIGNIQFMVHRIEERQNKPWWKFW